MNITLSHRPKFKDIPKIEADTIVTLMMDREGGSEICSAVRAAGKTSLWYPYTVKGCPPVEKVANVVKGTLDVSLLVASGTSVFVHCSAGLHRTGTFTYAVLRRLGYEPDDAVDVIRQLRPRSAEEIMPYLDWAERTLW